MKLHSDWKSSFNANGGIDLRPLKSQRSTS